MYRGGRWPLPGGEGEIWRVSNIAPFPVRWIAPFGEAGRILNTARSYVNKGLYEDRAKFPSI